jgi:phosphate/sulfate permease
MNNQTLRYTNTVEDSVAFNLFIAADHPQCRRAVASARRSAGIGTVVGAAVISLRHWSIVPVLGGMIAAPIVAFLFGIGWQHLIRRNIAKNARQAGEHFTCEHELSLADSELVESTRLTEHRIAYSAIARVERSRDLAFIFVDKFLAHVVPVRRVTEGNAEAFLAELELRRSHSGRPTYAGA